MIDLTIVRMQGTQPKAIVEGVGQWARICARAERSNP